MNLSDYRHLRDSLALEHYSARLPILKAEIAQLYAEIEPIWAALRAHFVRYGLNADREYNEKHDYEKIYERMEDRDALYQRLTAELQHIEAELPKVRTRLAAEPMPIGEAVPA